MTKKNAQVNNTNNMKWMKLIGLNVILALCVTAVNLFSDLLSVPPLELTLIRPAGSICLFAVYIWGPRVLPGLIVGIFGLAIYKITHIIIGPIGLKHIVAILIFGSISFIKTAIGYWLLKKYVGISNPLTEIKSIFLFIIFAGPISSFLPALISTAGAIYVEYLDASEFLYYASVWFSASNMGAFLIMPFMLIFLSTPGGIWTRRIYTIAIPIFTINIILLITIYQSIGIERERIKTIFNSHADRIHSNVEKQFEQHKQIAALLGDIINSDSALDKDKFSSIANKILSRQPHLEGIAWLPKISDKKRAYFEKHEIGNKIHIFKNRTQEKAIAPSRKLYFPVLYSIHKTYVADIIGINTTNSQDIATIFTHASTHNKIAMIDTKMGHLYRGTGSITIIPIYNNKVHIDDNLTGMIVIAFSPQDVIINTLNTDNNLNLDYKITNKDILIYSNIPTTTISRKTKANPFIKRIGIKHVDSDIVITYTPSDKFNAELGNWKLWWLVALAILFSFLISITLFIITGQVANRDVEVKRRTSQLRNEIIWREKNAIEQKHKNLALQSIATDTDLKSTLQQLNTIIELRLPNAITSVLLLTEDGKHFITIQENGLSDHYNTLVEAEEIGLGKGSCWESAVTRKPVIVEDIFNHPNWENYSDLAASENLSSCWSFPIMCPDEDVLGTFAIYHRHPAFFNPNDKDWIEDIVNIASIAVKKEQSESNLKHLVYNDTLTQLPNRHACINNIQSEVSKAEKTNQFGSILFIDLDNFKTLNDSLGHEYGDILLTKLAQRLASSINKESLIARWGGDEFVVLSSNLNASLSASRENALQTASAIKDSLTDPFDLEGYYHRVTCSIGISVFHQNNSDVTSILKQADTAMYSAKAMGRNAISFYEHSMQKIADAKFEMDKDLREALEEDQFSMAYQPLFNSSKAIIGAEALIRWHHPSKGNISPVEFIPLAESTGLIKSLSEWVITAVFKRIKLWPSVPYISINISPIHFHQNDFVEFITNNLKEADISGQRVMLEITEGTMLGNTAVVLERLQQLRGLGIGISLDDFGTGYSSLSYLSNLTIDQIKIDQSFIQAIQEDEESSAIIEAILSMSKHLQVDVVAEGIETNQQFTYLTDQHCDYFQGYLLGYPCNPEEFHKKYL